jgi:hypothetical protein
MATVTNRGKNALKAVGLPASHAWTALTAVAIAAGSSIIVSVGKNNYGDGLLSVTWNGVSLASDAYLIGPSATEGGNYSVHNVSAGTGDLVLTNNSFNWSIGSSACVTMAEVTGLATTSTFDQKQTASGTSTAPATAVTPTTLQASELLFGTHLVKGPTGDTDVTTNAGDTGTRETVKNGTSGGSGTTNIYQDTMYATVAATGTYKHSWSGMTSGAWIAVISTYKIAVVVPTGFLQMFTSTR